MPKSLLVLAFLGAVLVGFIAQMFLPATPNGRALSFVAFGFGFYPLARALWFTDIPRWRYWAGLAVGTAIGWSLDVWRTGNLSADMNYTIGVIVVGFCTAGLLYSLWKTRRRHATEK